MEAGTKLLAAAAKSDFSAVRFEAPAIDVTPIDVPASGPTAAKEFVGWLPRQRSGRAMTARGKAPIQGSSQLESGV